MQAWKKMSLFVRANTSSSVQVDNENKDILILGKGPTQGLDDTTLMAELNILLILHNQKKRFILRLHNNGSNSFLFVNATKSYQVKAKGSKIKDCKLCLGNVWKDFTINKMKKKKKKRIKRNFNFFSVDFNPIYNNEILDIHKYLMKEK